MAVVDEALTRFPFIDADRLGVTGGSYGGYMTTWIAGHTDRFKAACSERACNNLIALEVYAATSPRPSAVGSAASHLDDPDEYRRQSPITYVRDITTPMLILHSEEDLAVPDRAGRRAVHVACGFSVAKWRWSASPGESHELSRIRRTPAPGAADGSDARVVQSPPVLAREP